MFLLYKLWKSIYCIPQKILNKIDCLNLLIWKWKNILQLLPNAFAVIFGIVWPSEWHQDCSFLFKEKMWGHYLTMRLWKIGMAICKIVFKKWNKIIQILWGAVAVPNVRTVGSKLNSLKTVKYPRGKVLLGQNTFDLNINFLFNIFIYPLFLQTFTIPKLRETLFPRVLQWGPKHRKCIRHIDFKIMVMSLDESLIKTDQGKNKYRAKSKLYHCENPSKGVLWFKFGGYFQELGLGYHQHEVKPNWNRTLR